MSLLANALRTRINNAIRDYNALNAFGLFNPNELWGIAVNANNYTVDLCKADECPNNCEWYDMRYVLGGNNHISELVNVYA